MRTPSFIGIGAMRAGTSWLSRNLGCHPDIYLGTKELHYFDRRLESGLLPLLPDFIGRLRYRCFFFRGAMRGKVTGEYTPAYAVLPQRSIERVRQWLPDVKLLFLTRDPLERAWSHARKNFPEFRGKGVDEASLDELMLFFRSEGVAKRGDYATCIRNWLEFFPREQFFFSSLEEIAQDPFDVLKRAFAFLGVDPSVPVPDSATRPINPRTSAPLPEGVRGYLVALREEQRPQVEALIGQRVPW